MRCPPFFGVLRERGLSRGAHAVGRVAALAGVTLLARYLEHRLADRAGSSALMNFGAGLISWPLFVAFLNGLFYLTGAGIYRLPAG